MRRIVQYLALGIDTLQAVRARLAEVMASKADPAATNMMLGGPYYPINLIVGGTLPGIEQLLPRKEEKKEGSTSMAQ